MLIAYNHDVVRKGLAALVSTESDMQVVAEAIGSNEALKMFAKHLPDLLLLDLRMPDKNGIQTIVEIQIRFQDAGILVLSTFDGNEDIYRELRAGAKGYVLKNTSRDKLIPTLRTVASGQNSISKGLSNLFAMRKMQVHLTTREVEVLNQLAKGLSNKEIAHGLDISEYTVKVYLKSIFRKLDVADRTKAVTTAIQRGIIHLQSHS